MAPVEAVQLSRRVLGDLTVNTAFDGPPVSSSDKLAKANRDLGAGRSLGENGAAALQNAVVKEALAITAAGARAWKKGRRGDELPMHDDMMLHDEHQVKMGIEGVVNILSKDV